jgi:hypothetical protein
VQRSQRSTPPAHQPTHCCSAAPLPPTHSPSVAAQQPSRPLAHQTSAAAQHPTPPTHPHARPPTHPSPHLCSLHTCRRCSAQARAQSRSMYCHPCSTAFGPFCPQGWYVGCLYCWGSRVGLPCHSLLGGAGTLRVQWWLTHSHKSDLAHTSQHLWDWQQRQYRGSSSTAAVGAAAAATVVERAGAASKSKAETAAVSENCWLPAPPRFIRPCNMHSTRCRLLPMKHV